MDKYKNYVSNVIINRADLLGTGSTSDVYSCDFGGTFAYKEFVDEDYAKFVEHRLLRLVTEYNPTGFIFPYRLIYGGDKKLKGYVMDYLYQYKGFESLKDLDYSKKIEILKKARELVIKFHKDYNCVHSDLGIYNFQYNSDRDTVKLIDFDFNISLKDKDIDYIEYYNIYAKDYLSLVGVDEGLDIFLFNLTVFSLLNKVRYYDTMEYIANRQFGVFQGNVQAIKIFDSYNDLGCKKALKKEFVDF